MQEPGAKEIFIHIGAQKTASSMLRRSLVAMEPDLRAEGVALIKRDEIKRTPLFAYLQRMNKGAVSAGDPPPPAVARSLAKIIDRPESRILMTSEKLFSRLQLDSFYQNIRESLRFLKKNWAGHKIRIILYVRSQPSFVESCYSQFVAMGRTLSFDEFTGGGVPTHLNWHSVCGDIADVIGAENLFVRPYETIKEVGAIEYVKDFLRILRLDDQLAEKVAQIDAEGAKSNRGLSDPAIEIARFSNSILQPKDRLRLRKFLQNNLSTATHPKPAFWTDDQIASMKSVYEASNRALFADFITDQEPSAYGYI